MFQTHYENMLMQYKERFKVVKNENFSQKNFDLGGSNEYPQSMFWSKNKKNRYTPANPNFTI